VTTTTKSGIGAISLVCVTSPDQDSAVEFYEKLGFEKRTDTPFGNGYRWIEVYPPSGETGIALAPPPEDQSHTPMVTGITLPVEDIDATHAAFTQLGVDVDAEVMRMGGPVPPIFWFRDPNGNTLMVVEQP
jgi:predicted enzyme related to lactoylglutathione lyase